MHFTLKGQKIGRIVPQQTQLVREEQVLHRQKATIMMQSVSRTARGATYVCAVVNTRYTIEELFYL